MEQTSLNSASPLCAHRAGWALHGQHWPWLPRLPATRDRSSEARHNAMNAMATIPKKIQHKAHVNPAQWNLKIKSKVEFLCLHFPKLQQKHFSFWWCRIWVLTSINRSIGQWWDLCAQILGRYPQVLDPRLAINGVSGHYAPKLEQPSGHYAPKLEQPSSLIPRPLHSSLIKGYWWLKIPPFPPNHFFCNIPPKTVLLDPKTPKRVTIPLH